MSASSAYAAEPESSLSLGYKAYQNDNFEKAIEYLETAIKDEPMLSDYARYYLGEAYLALGRFDNALNAFNGCAADLIKSPLASDALERMADAYLAKGDTINSIDTYKNFIEKYQNNSQTPAVLYKLVSILLSNNMHDDAVPFIKRLMTEFPDYPNPQTTMNDIKKLNTDEFNARIKAVFKARDYKKAANEIELYLFETPPRLGMGNNIKDNNAALRLLQGQAFYQAGDYQNAKRVFKDIFSNADDSKTMGGPLIWLARTYIRLKDFKSAGDALKLIVTIYTDRNIRDEAIYRLAMIAKEQGDINRAAGFLSQLLTENPASFYKNDALWQIGWTHYTQGNLEKSIEALKPLEDSPLRMRALYWQGKIYIALGNKPYAERLFKAAADSFPPTYYSSMSKKALNAFSDSEFGNADLKPQIPNPPIDTFEGRPQPKINLDDSWQTKRVQRLLALGLNGLALKELAAMDRRQNPAAISLLYKDAGDFYHSYIAARNSPCYFTCQLSFPEGYKELTEEAAHEAGLDPFLVYAVMMQESEFDEKAVSNAGAIGLLQIMPNTGKWIAQRLSDPWFKNDDLLLPPINISFGAWYLKTLIAEFNGNLPLAIAAYNAGPNAVTEWLKKWGDADMDEFVENIPYPETRKYVEKVMGYYEAYKTIYGRHLQTNLALDGRGVKHP